MFVWARPYLYLLREPQDELAIEVVDAAIPAQANKEGEKFLPSQFAWAKMEGRGGSSSSNTSSSTAVICDLDL